MVVVAVFRFTLRLSDTYAFDSTRLSAVNSSSRKITSIIPQTPEIVREL